LRDDLRVVEAAFAHGGFGIGAGDAAVTVFDPHNLRDRPVESCREFFLREARGLTASAHGCADAPAVRERGSGRRTGK
jgi:hypothetical protein